MIIICFKYSHQGSETHLVDAGLQQPSVRRLLRPENRVLPYLTTQYATFCVVQLTYSLVD